MINELNQEIISKLAEGNVIERPADIVKELIENALDAGATEIKIDVEDYGKKTIKIFDNGEGMDEDDLLQSCMHHRTSKIAYDEDLKSIRTWGFRGEALAEIAAISYLTITTKQKEELEGCEISFEDGDMRTMGKVSSKDGTTIEVKEIFHKTPTKLKQMDDSEEINQIIDIVQKYALINPKIHFELKHNKNLILHSKKLNSFIENIISIHGKEIAEKLIKVNYSEDNIKVQGYIGKPSLMERDKSMQAIFVNRRVIKDSTISEALYEAYHTLLFTNKQPAAILNISIHPRYTNVHVHPKKEAIKFKDLNKVRKAVFDATKNSLEENDLAFEKAPEEKKGFFQRFRRKD